MCSYFRALRKRYGRRLRGGSHPASLASRPPLWYPCPHPRSGAGGEDDGFAPFDRPPDPPSDLLGFQIDHHRLGAVGLDIACLLLLADESRDLVAIFGQHPYQTPRRLAVRASDQYPHEITSFEPGPHCSLYPSWGGRPVRQKSSRGQPLKKMETLSQR